MTKKELAKKFSARTGLMPVKSEKCVEIFLELITEALERGERICFADLFSMKLVKKAQRMGRNPKTGEPAVIPARRTIRVTTGKKISLLK